MMQKYSKNYVFEGTDLLSLTKVKSENGSWKDVEICDKEGNAITHVTNKNKDNEPHIAAYGNDGSITINFLNPNYKKSDSAFDEFIILDIKNGEKAVINKDGSVNVTKADGTIAKYDKDGSLISTVKYTYDENGKKAKAVRTEPNGTVTEFTYKNGVKSSAVKTNSAGTVTNYSYNSNGVVVSARAVTAKGIVYEYTYKNGIKSDAVRYVYDKNNNVISQRTYSYDKNGKNAAVKTQIRYKYNENGKLKSETKIFKGDAIENGVAKTVITYKSDGVTVDSIKKYDANGKKVD